MRYLLKNGTIVEGNLTPDNLMIKVKTNKGYEFIEVEQIIDPNKYNIITAPKSIKLSEIVERLNSCDKHNDFNIIVKEDSLVIENYTFRQEYFYIRDNKIFDLSYCMVRDEYKFMYALWIAGTEIIDDLKEVE